MKSLALAFQLLLPLLIPAFLQSQDGPENEYLASIEKAIREKMGPVFDSLPTDPPDALEEMLAKLEKGKKKALATISDNLPEGSKITAEEIAAIPLALVAENLCDPTKPWKVEHFLVATQHFLRIRGGEAAVQIGEAGLKKFPDSRFLLDNTGLAHLLAYNNSESNEKEGLERAYKLLTKATTLEPDTFHSYTGLFQVAHLLGKHAEALRAWEKMATMQSPAKLMPHPCRQEGVIRLLAGDFAGAAKVLDVENGPLEDPQDSILAMRARALAGDASRAEEIAATFPTQGETGRLGRWARADLLIFLGKTKAARRCLASPPLPRLEKEAEADFKLSQQAHAALRLLVGLKPATYTRIRKALPKALGHEFVVLDPRRKGKPRKVNLNSSPLAMAMLMSGCPSSPKDGGNKILLALAAHAMRTYKPNSIERKVLMKSAYDTNEELQHLRTPQGLQDCLDDLQSGIAESDLLGALLAWRLAQDLRQRHNQAEKKLKRVK